MLLDVKWKEPPGGLRREVRMVVCEEVGSDMDGLYFSNMRGVLSDDHRKAG